MVALRINKIGFVFLPFNLPANNEAGLKGLSTTGMLFLLFEAKCTDVVSNFFDGLQRTDVLGCFCFQISLDASDDTLRRWLSCLQRG